MALCFTVAVLLLFVVGTTVFMALQSRQTVAQSRRMDELEKLSKLLHQRIETLERQLAASNSPGSEQGKEKDTSFRSDNLELSNKVRLVLRITDFHGTASVSTTKLDISRLLSKLPCKRYNYSLFTVEKFKSWIISQC